MGDNINNLPTDDYPPSVEDKRIIETFFAPLTEDVEDNYDYMKLPIAVFMIYMIISSCYFEDFMKNIIGNVHLRYAVKGLLFSISIYILKLYNYI